MTLIDIENIAATALGLWLIMLMIKIMPQEHRHDLIDALFYGGIIVWIVSGLIWVARVWG